MAKAINTRLSYVRSKNPDLLGQWLRSLKRRVQIYGSPIWNGKQWYVWFVPGEQDGDMPSIDLDNV